MPEPPDAAIRFTVVEFAPGRPLLAGPLATELASLEDAELIHILDVAVIERAADGRAHHRPASEVELGDLRPLAATLGSFLAPGDLRAVVGAIRPGWAAAVVVWEDTWAEPMLALARECGGEVVADGCVARGGTSGSDRIVLVSSRASDETAP